MTYMWLCCRDVTVVILDRPRHADIIAECRAAGARIRLISDGDVAAAIEVATPSSAADVLFGIGGTPEGAFLDHQPQNHCMKYMWSCIVRLLHARVHDICSQGVPCCGALVAIVRVFSSKQAS